MITATHALMHLCRTYRYASGAEYSGVWIMGMAKCGELRHEFHVPAAAASDVSCGPTACGAGGRGGSSADGGDGPRLPPLMTVSTSRTEKYTQQNVYAEK